MTVQLINGGHALQSGFQFEFPKHLAVASVERAQPPVACSGEEQTAGRNDWSHLREVTPGIMNALFRKLRHLAERNLPRYRPLIQVVRSEGCPGRRDRRQPGAGEHE